MHGTWKRQKRKGGNQWHSCYNRNWDTPSIIIDECVFPPTVTELYAEGIRIEVTSERERGDDIAIPLSKKL